MEIDIDRIQLLLILHCKPCEALAFHETSIWKKYQQNTYITTTILIETLKIRNDERKIRAYISRQLEKKIKI